MSRSKRPTTREGRRRAVKPAVRAKRHERMLWDKLSGKAMSAALDKIIANPDHPLFKWAYEKMEDRLFGKVAEVQQALNPGQPLGVPLALPPPQYSRARVTEIWNEDGSLAKQIGERVSPPAEDVVDADYTVEG